LLILPFLPIKDIPAKTTFLHILIICIFTAIK